MQYLFAILIVVALAVCAMAQLPYYYGSYYNTPAVAYPYGAYGAYGTYGAYGAYGAHNYGVYNPALSYLWKK